MDISPSDFVNLTLPIYRAMSPMAGPLGVPREELISMLTTPNHYTSVSFIRLVALASRRLRLSPAHFRAVLQALMHDSGMMLATNLSQEQVGQLVATNLNHDQVCRSKYLYLQFGSEFIRALAVLPNIVPFLAYLSSSMSSLAQF